MAPCEHTATAKRAGGQTVALAANGRLEKMEAMKWLKEKDLAPFFESGMKKLGVLVSDEQAEERINFCRTKNNGEPCEYHGEVEPLPGVICEGCTRCGCALKAKAAFDHFKLINHKVKCPHPDGNLWANIDLKFSEQ